MNDFYTKIKYSIKQKNDIQNFNLERKVGSISDPVLVIKLSEVIISQISIFSQFFDIKNLKNLLFF